MIAPVAPFKTPPMPDVRKALIEIECAREALQRAANSWNRDQVLDAFRSVRFWLDKAERVLDNKVTP